MTEESTVSVTADEYVDAVVVGAGFSGLYMLYRLRHLGLSVKVIEAGDGVGGTWYWNRYPGARCDVESMEYCYSFDDALQQEWQWTERYPKQAEILRYLNHVADRFQLRPQIELSTRVLSAHYQAASKTWRVRTDRGGVYNCAFCIMASGNLSTVRVPPFVGIERFKGTWHHTARWPDTPVDFTGQRVGVIGTGSTGIQLIPQVAAQAEHLHVFQRTPNFSIPAHNGPLDPVYESELKSRYAAHRQAGRESMFGIPCEMPTLMAKQVGDEERRTKFEAAWAYGGANRILLAYADLLVNEEANATVSDFVRDKIRATVNDPKVADLLCPTDHPLGTKRICVDTDYYSTYNRPNVTLVDVRKAPIEEITESGLRTTEASYDLDVLIFATGFDAMTGALNSIDIEGRQGAKLKTQWEDGPKTYLGLMVSGFPNLFIVTGPGSPSVLSNVVVSIEQHVEWIAQCIAHLRAQGLSTIEANAEAQDKWVQHVAEVGNTTLFPKADSWYTGANIPGKKKIFMPYVGGVGTYAQVCREVVAKGYDGFQFSR
jgi:cyclohexanone monooxygenase